MAVQSRLLRDARWRCTRDSVLVARMRTARFGPKVCLPSLLSPDKRMNPSCFWCSSGNDRMPSSSDVSILVYSDEPPCVDAYDASTRAPCSAWTTIYARTYRPFFLHGQDRV